MNDWFVAIPVLHSRSRLVADVMAVTPPAARPFGVTLLRALRVRLRWTRRRLAWRMS